MALSKWLKCNNNAALYSVRMVFVATTADAERALQKVGRQADGWKIISGMHVRTNNRPVRLPIKLEDIARYVAVVVAGRPSPLTRHPSTVNPQ